MNGKMPKNSPEQDVGSALLLLLWRTLTGRRDSDDTVWCLTCFGKMPAVVVPVVAPVVDHVVATKALEMDEECQHDHPGLAKDRPRPAWRGSESRRRSQHYVALKALAQSELYSTEFAEAFGCSVGKWPCL